MVSPTRLALSIALSLISTTQGYVIKVDNHQGNLHNYEVRSSNLTAEEFLRTREPVTFRRDIEERNLGERQCFASTTYSYKIIGNGNPHQNYKIGQVANTLISCPGTVATGESHTFGWSIGGGFNPGSEAYDFASVGFSVGESDTKTVTDSFECAGSMTEICAMHYTAVTAVTVDFYSVTENCGVQSTQDEGTGVVYLPNSNGIGSTVSRGTNFGDRNIIQCRGQAAREVDFYCGPAGGPEWFDTNEYGPWSDAYMAALDPAGCAVPIEALKFDS
ncbi:hypothetical protein NA57DRAFT_75939 [Rhizodiscina lignyota]|uniref:Uncharacterized protein n=1 Tax=Rhizodiscina lignyota TaxID=1504668 RepID=A0A9P4IG68_9PEZI|nr:hypothetical protein NA57DRAFT_75939 [Rhizodiscina lignyota]